jgi:AGZA family xanthine/uracil permease-like MFS transporter
VTVALCFLGALFLHPVIRMVPAVATAPVLVMVGILMMQGIGHLNLQELPLAVPSVLMLLLMPLTSSISEGLAMGFFVYVVLQVGVGRARQVTLVGYLLAVLFGLHFLWR